MVPIISRAIGKSINDILNDSQELLEIITKGEKQDYKQDTANGESHYQIKFTPVLHRKKASRPIITFVDLTDRIHLQDKLKSHRKYRWVDKGLVYNRTFFLQRTEELLGNENLNSFGYHHV